MKKHCRSQESGSAYFYRFDSKLCSDGFVDKSCFEFYILRLLQRSRLYGIRLHAYCVMQKEILLVGTAVSSTAPGYLANSLDSSYSDYLNLRYSRHLRRFTGSIHQCVLLDDASVLEAQKYVETQACRKLHLEHPGTWHWSSYNANAFAGQAGKLIRHRAVKKFLRAGNGGYDRYRNWLGEGFSAARLAWLDNQLNRGSFLSANLRKKNARVA
jgi:hypothetical protein